MTVSIIIAVKTWQRRLEECVAKCRELDFPDFEILVLPDAEQGQVPELSTVFQTKGPVPIQLRIIPTGPVSPGRKRDIALDYARGEILAFIDDDAYPGSAWLKNAVSNFSDPDVAAVGGPAVTPETDDPRQKASGRVYASFLVSGRYVYRYLPGKRQAVDDYPSCNFLVRKEVMQRLGGFNTRFWPGEDTKLCLDITKKLGKKIIYDPGVVVYHHRRPLFAAHLRQVASYALHRGYFVRKYPETSLRPAYFVPSIFLAGVLIGGVSLMLFPLLMIPYSSGLLLYLVLVFCASIRRVRSAHLVFPGIILSHLVYGMYFLKGLSASRLQEEK